MALLRRCRCSCRRRSSAGISIAVRSSSDDGRLDARPVGPGRRAAGGHRRRHRSCSGRRRRPSDRAAALGTGLRRRDRRASARSPTRCSSPSASSACPTPRSKLRRTDARRDPGPAHAGGRGRRADADQRNADIVFALAMSRAMVQASLPDASPRDQALAVLPFSIQDLDGFDSLADHVRGGRPGCARAAGRSRPHRRRRRRADQLDRLPDGSADPGRRRPRQDVQHGVPSRAALTASRERLGRRTDDRFFSCNDLRLAP